MIINDHTQTAQEMTKVIASTDPSAQLPTGVSATDQRHLATLQRDGGSFDTTYRSQMIATHEDRAEAL